MNHYCIRPTENFLCLLPCGLSDLYLAVSNSMKITLADRYGLMAAVCNPTATEEELRVINRLCWLLGKGKLQVVNEISALIQG